MKYLSPKRTVLYLIASFFIFSLIYAMPIVLQDMTLQKIVSVSYIIIGTITAGAFFLVNGASTTIVESDYEKEFYKKIKNGTAENEGENLHWNPLSLSLARRIYYSKILLCILFPIVVLFFLEYIFLLIDML